MSKNYKTTGIILTRRDYAEADKIYTILTQQRKVSAIARGVRKSQAKLSSHLDLFAEIELMLIEGKKLDIITSARIVEHTDIAEDYERLQTGFLFLEMADKLTDTEDIGGVYDLLNQHIKLLKEIPISVCELGFKLKLLLELGQKPDMSLPVSDSEIHKWGFDIEHGRLVDASSALAIAMSQDEIKLWRLMFDQPTESVAKVGGVEAAAKSSLRVCNQFITQQFGVSFRAK